MRRLMTMVSVAAVMAVSSIAALAEEVTGAIANVDAHANTVTLEGGETYALPEDVDAATFSVGEKVKITVQQGDDGNLVVVRIARSS